MAKFIFDERSEFETFVSKCDLIKKIEELKVVFFINDVRDEFIFRLKDDNLGIIYHNNQVIDNQNLNDFLNIILKYYNINEKLNSNSLNEKLLTTFKSIPIFLQHIYLMAKI